jgi:hypothetical protein
MNSKKDFIRSSERRRIYNSKKDFIRSRERREYIIPK